VKTPCPLLVLPYRAIRSGTFSVKRHQRLDLRPALSRTPADQHLESLGPVGSYGLPCQGEEALPGLWEAEFGYSFLLEERPQSQLAHCPVNFGSFFEQSYSFYHIKYGSISELITQTFQF